MNEFKDKVIVFDGDSICHGGSEQNGDACGWAYRVGTALEMEWYNYAVGGATVTTDLYSSRPGNPRHWISSYIDVIRNKHEKLDYLILEGGTNDADLLGMESDSFGELDPLDFSGNYDNTTFTGAFETLFYKAITYYPTAKIGFIVAPKMGDCKSKAFVRRRHYFLRAIEICKKWGIPYVDLWEGSPLNPSLLCYYDPDLSKEENIEAGKAYVDGQHLTGLGYDIISSKIIAFIKSL